MKYVKILGLLAVAAAALMAFAASASADTVTTDETSTGGPAAATTPTIHAVSEEGAVPGTKHVSLHNPNANIECESTVSGTVTKHPAGGNVEGNITALSFFNCTSGWTVTVNTLGTLTLDVTETDKATLISHGTTVTATLNLGIFGHVTCRYSTAATPIGTLTGTAGPNKQGTLDIKAEIPFESGSGLCGGQKSNWTGNYITTHPLHLDVT